MNYLKTVDNEFYRQRLSGPLIIITVSFIILISRLFYLQIIEGHKYFIMSENNCIRLQVLTAPRGLIFDRNNKLLVDNRPSFDVSVVPKDALPFNYVLSKTANFLNMDQKELIRKVRSAKGIGIYKPMMIKKDVGRKSLASIEVNKYDLPGVIIDVNPKRHYLQKSAVHLIGYLGEINSKQLKMNKYKEYKRGDFIGKCGVEKIYESAMRGKRGGRQVEVNVTGQVLRVIDTVKPQPGNNIFLTIDIDLQKFAQDLIKDNNGAIIAMNPQNGYILCLVSSPLFDQEIFLGGMSQEQWNSLVNDKNKPLQNRAIQGRYPPGSVYKIVTAMAGLEEDIFDCNEKLDCPGFYRFGNRIFKCWKRQGHGSMNIIDALAQSCDVYFYQLGQKLGVDRIAHYSKKCGFGSLTGIELDHEEQGLIPTSEWKKNAKNEPWYKGETLSIAIGQGYNEVTPLQVANLISAIGNGGILYKPQILKSIKTVEGWLVKDNKPVIIGRLPANNKTMRLIRTGLWNAVNKPGGTAYWTARSKKYDIAGKTGTAQVVGMKKQQKDGKSLKRFEDHAWFAAFAPFDYPEIAVVVLVENGGHGSSTAAPIAKKIIKEYLGNKK